MDQEEEEDRPLPETEEQLKTELVLSLKPTTELPHIFLSKPL